MLLAVGSLLLDWCSADELRPHPAWAESETPEKPNTKCGTRSTMAQQVSLTMMPVMLVSPRRRTQWVSGCMGARAMLMSKPASISDRSKARWVRLDIQRFKHCNYCCCRRRLGCLFSVANNQRTTTIKKKKNQKLHRRRTKTEKSTAGVRGELVSSFINAQAGCEATMVSLLDYYYHIIVAFWGYNLGTGVGERDQSETDKQTLETRIQIESMGASTGSGKGVSQHP